MCDEWRNSYVSFKEWAISHGYRDDLTINRIDNNGSYSPENCEWVTIKEQCRNRCQNVTVTINGETKILIDWAREYGINPKTVYNRINVLGWDDVRAVTTPSRKKIG